MKPLATLHSEFLRKTGSIYKHAAHLLRVKELQGDLGHYSTSIKYSNFVYDGLNAYVTTPQSIPGTPSICPLDPRYYMNLIKKPYQFTRSFHLQSAVLTPSKSIP